MNWDVAGVMVAISGLVSTGMGFVFSLMIRSAIAEAVNKLTHELHALVSENYVRKDVYDRDQREMRAAIKWVAEEAAEKD